MAVPTMVGGSTSGADGGNTTGTVVTMPTNSAGDYIFIPIASDAISQTFTQASFTTLYNNVDIPTSSPTATFAMFYKTSSGSEPGTYTVTCGTSERQAWFSFSIAGATGIGNVATNSSGNSATATIPALTTGFNNSLAIGIIATDSVSTPHGTASGWTKLGEISGTSAASLSVFYQTAAVVGTIASQNVSITSEQWLGIAFEIKGSASGGLIYPRRMDGLGALLRGMDS